MASDWIKVQTDLVSDPRVVGIARRLKVAPALALGPIVAFWSIADRHAQAIGEGSRDALLTAYTAEDIDLLVGVPGFAAAYAGVGWMRITEAGAVLVRWLDHNGQSAKARAQDTERKRLRRDDQTGRSAPAMRGECPDRVRRHTGLVAETVRNGTGHGRDENRTREEKRREDVPPSEAAPPRPPLADGPAANGTHAGQEPPPPPQTAQPQERPKADPSRWAARRPDEADPLLGAAPWRPKASRHELRGLTEVCRQVELAAERGEVALEPGESLVGFLIRRARAYGQSDTGRKFPTSLRKWLNDGRWLAGDEAWADARAPGAGPDPDRIREHNLREADRRREALAAQRACAVKPTPEAVASVSAILNGVRRRAPVAAGVPGGVAGEVMP